MLDLAPPFAELAVSTGEGGSHRVLVFRDHEDLDLFWYLPPPPRLVEVEGKPSFSLVKYRRSLGDADGQPPSSRGGGLALLEVEAAVTGAQLVLLQAEVASFFERPDARLLPVVFREGTVRAIVARSEGGHLIEDTAETRVASPTAPHSALFALGLSHEGATLLEQAAAGGSLPVGVQYELRFDGLMPALHAHVVMEYDRIYQRFAASVGFEYYVGVELDADLAWLVENDLITIEITQFSSDEDADRQRQQVLELVKARLLQDFFRSTMPPSPTEQPNPLSGLMSALTGGGEVSASSAFVTLKARYEMQDELKRFEMIYDSRAAVELTHQCTGFLSRMLAGRPFDVAEYDAFSEYFSELQVDVRSAIDWEGMAELQVVALELRHGDRTESRTFERGGETSFLWRVPITDAEDDEYSWRVEYTFDPARGGGAHAIEASGASRSRVLVVHPLEHVHYRVIRVRAEPLDWQLTPRLWVELRVPPREGSDEGEPARALSRVVLDEATPEITWAVRLQRGDGELKILARVDSEGEDGVLLAGQEAEVRTGLLVARGPYVSSRTVRLVCMADWDDVRQVVVDVRLGSAEERSLLFDQASPGELGLSFPQQDADERSWSWKQTVIFHDGRIETTDWTVTEDSVVTIAPAVDERQELRVVLLPSEPAPLGVRVDVWVVPEGEEEEVQLTEFLPEGSREVVLRLPPSGNGLDYRWGATAYTSEGEQDLGSGEGESSVLILRVS